MKTFLVACCLALASASGSLAATGATFDLAGTVLDESGLGLTGVRLTLVNDATGFERVTHTNDSGRYSFAVLPAGVYSLAVQLSGYATSRYAGLRYFADTKPVFNVTLRLRDVQESMTFTGEAPLINTSQSQIGLSVEERQLQELPLSRRDYLELVTLEGAVQENTITPPGKPVVAVPVQSINGNNVHYSSYQLDGFNNTRDQHGVVKVDVSLDSLEEFRVISGQFSTEYGPSLGGLVDATTKAYGGDFHGSLFAFFRPGAWDSDDPLTGRDTALDRQDVGFTLSGPVHDNTHFFASFDYRNMDERVMVTAPFDQGRFSGLFDLPTRRTRFLGKLSHRFDESYQLTGKFILSDRDSLESVGGYDIYDNRLQTVNDDIAASATLVSQLGSAVSELRVAFASEQFRADGAAAPLGRVQIHPTAGNIGNLTNREQADERHWQIAETLSFSKGNHGLETGFSFFRIDSTTTLSVFDNGALYFAPEKPEEPILFWKSSLTPGASPELERSENHFQVFVQDDWQLTPYFSINLGLQWERESSVPDNNNVAPRIGFDWDASRDGRTSVRGGYGVFYSFVFSIVDTLERLYGPDAYRLVALTPEDSGFEPGFEEDTLQPANLYVPAPEYATSSRNAPYAQHITLGFERELWPSLSLAVDGSFIRGSDLILPSDLNAPGFFDYTGGNTRTGVEADATRPFGVPGASIPPGVDPTLPNGFPFSGYRDLYLLDSRGSSRYWSLKVNVTKRYANDFMFQAVYNWSRTRNDGDDFRVTESLPLNPADPEAEWSRSWTDIPHSLVVNGVWDAPWGFRLTGIFRARSGQAADPRVDDDLDGDRKLRERASTTGRILERNSFRTRSAATLDMSLSKTWELGRGRRLEGAIDFLNLTNRLNPRQFLQSYGPNAGAPLESFLSIVQASRPRQFQLSVRFLF